MKMPLTPDVDYIYFFIVTEINLALLHLLTCGSSVVNGVPSE